MRYQYEEFVWKPKPSRTQKDGAPYSGLGVVPSKMEGEGFWYDDTLGSRLNDYASAGWRLFTVRRIQEKPFELLVIMERKVPAKRRTKRNKRKH